ncbi:MAG: hypothetical protein K0U66_05460 [Gammaproteobacteria bacterium]|nr:hypothetical protein [Gammaproteobacteria bacterium]
MRSTTTYTVFKPLPATTAVLALANSLMSARQAPPTPPTAQPPANTTPPTTVVLPMPAIATPLLLACRLRCSVFGL